MTKAPAGSAEVGTTCSALYFTVSALLDNQEVAAIFLRTPELC